MKDSLLINNKLSNYFWAKAIETANYLKNRLPTKIKTYREVIPKKA